MTTTTFINFSQGLDLFYDQATKLAEQIVSMDGEVPSGALNPTSQVIASLEQAIRDRESELNQNERPDEDDHFADEAERIGA